MAEYPIYLKLGIVLQDVFGEVTWVTTVLIEVVCPAHHSPLLDREYALNTERKQIAEHFLYSIKSPPNS
jgi:hypothetical protein